MSKYPYFEKPLWLNPRNPNIFYNYLGLGFCHLLLAHADEAVDFCRRAYASAPPIWYVPLSFAAALGLKGDNREAQEMLHEFYKLKPEINSIAKLRALLRVRYSNPKYAELAEKTCDLGLRRAGMPEE